MKTDQLLNEQSYLPHKNPKKIIFMLHGYGDSAENFIHIAKEIDNSDFEINYFALDAPSSIPNHSLGRQWFDLYPNGIYIGDAGYTEFSIIYSQILRANLLLENTIEMFLGKYKLSYEDCFLLGFSQGGMMTFEFGNYFKNRLAGLAILSGRIFARESINNTFFLKTPIFISHGVMDSVLPIEIFHQSCEYMNKNKFSYESHLLEVDDHTISAVAINFLQQFIQKNL